MTAPAESAPYGSGHGLCFDVNSALAAEALTKLGPPPVGDAWVVQGGSDDLIQAGCSGVLSWMQVEWRGIHPGTHILFFTNGTYLGTATSKPYGYTEILDKTRDTVSVRYRWAKPNDALCCPQGGPSVVTFTLDGYLVHANGQFPPDN
ncbi:LppP/LprE family lipoprotein [Nocardia sp. NPDC051990]|uniref:LppP/LprE family lipoprotein n=1 Tax=Nocardia sp. NPDC051990 TaxID=3155285 RepID=UPI003438F298